MSTLLEKIQSVVAKHPIVVGGKKLTPQDAETVIWSRLANERIGVLKDDPSTHSLMGFVSERDFRTVFCDEDPKMALPSARCLMAQILKAEDETPPQVSGSDVGTAIADALAANRPIGQLKTKELLERYDADSPEEIWHELRERAKGQPCIAFMKGNGVAVALTLKIFQGIRKGEEYCDTFHDGERVWRLYHVGVFPQETALVCPIVGQILSNGYSSSLKASWAGVDEDCMVFVRVVKDANPSEDFTGRVAIKHLVSVAKKG